MSSTITGCSEINYNYDVRKLEVCNPTVNQILREPKSVLSSLSLETIFRVFIVISTTTCNGALLNQQYQEAMIVSVVLRCLFLSL